jgi:acetyltransferase-like isoleucine patch superfamily enzyme
MASEVADKETGEFWKIVLMNEDKFQTKPSLFSFVHSTAKLGRNVKVWQWASVLADCKIGDNVSIGANAEIGRGSIIGNNSRISHGVFLPTNSKIGENVFIGPSVTFTDDKHPVCGNVNYEAQPPVMEDWSSIGAGAVILPGIRIGMGALVGAGSIVTKDVPKGMVVMGNPARIYEK